MTRKHFREAASIVKDIVDPGERERTAIRFATLFRRYNSRFDQGRFFSACEVD